MRISDILLTSWVLLTLCGTYDHVMFRKRSCKVMFAVVLLCVLFLRDVTLENAWVSVYAPSVLLTGLLSACRRRGEWGGRLIVVLFGGMLGWKLSSSYPLFAETGLLLSVVYVSLSCIYCRSIQAKLSAVAGAAILSGLFQYVQDALLFGYGRVTLGNADLLDAQVISAYFLLNAECVLSSFKKKQRVFKQPATESV